MANFDFQCRATPVELIAGATVTVEAVFVDRTFTFIPSDFSVAWSGDLTLVSSSVSPAPTATFDTAGLPSKTYQIKCIITELASGTAIERTATITIKSFSEAEFIVRANPVIASGGSSSTPVDLGVASTLPGIYSYEWNLPVNLAGTSMGSWATTPADTSPTAQWIPGTTPTGKYVCKVTIRPDDRNLTEFKTAEGHVLVVSTTSLQDLISVLKANLDQQAEAIESSVQEIGSGVQEIGSGVQSIASQLGQLPGISSPVKVSLTRTDPGESEDQVLWSVIRNSTRNMSFDNYRTVIDSVLCPGRAFGNANDNALLGQIQGSRALPFPDVDGYRLLKVATEVFVMANAGIMHPVTGQVAFNLPGGGETTDRFGRTVTNANLVPLWNTLIAANGGTIPYLNLVAGALGVATQPAGLPGWGNNCFGILRERLINPYLLELIWSYWHEEGMLVQTMNAISRRFQNVRGPASGRDPLGELEIDPLRPLNNLLWGYIQDEQHRLPLVRRAYEYHHHYGISVVGSAVPKLRPADTRSKFLEAFHQLLHQTTLFFQQMDDTTVVPDGFPLLNALREVTLILSHGAHNQYGDLPWTARIEMLMQQWLLARTEMREFLGGRPMVAYPEPWMGRVDAMKKLQGWTDTSVMHFRDLAVLGEQIILSIRFGPWVAGGGTATQAVNWARYWRSEIQQYVHAYRTVTGVDLTLQPVGALDATPPSVHLWRRLEAQKRSA